MSKAVNIIKPNQYLLELDQHDSPELFSEMWFQQQAISIGTL